MARPVVIVRRRWQDFPPPTPQPTICKIWQGAIDRDGYGILSKMSHHDTPTRQKQRVYRWIWQQAHGPIPSGKVVRHKCDNRICYRLSHLELGTMAENNNDARERGHLGPSFTHPPSRIEKLFDDWDSWSGTQAEFIRSNPDISATTLRRYLKQGRAHFSQEENLGNTEHEYLDAPGGVHPVELLAEGSRRDGRPSRDVTSWRNRAR